MPDKAQSLIDLLNNALELDHDLVVKVFMGDVRLNELSPLYHRARDDRGLRVVSGIDLLSEVLGADITPVCEDGIIQGFTLAVTQS